MSFLARGDQGPENIPEGGVPIDMGVTNFSPRIFQGIARAGLEAAGEGSFKKTRRRGSKNRMAGQADSLSRSIERALQSGGGEGFLPEPRRTTTTVYSEGRGRKMPRPKARDRFVPSRPTPMTKEEYDRMPKKARRKFELAPGMEDLIDRFPTQGNKGKTRRGSKTRDEMRDPNARPTVRKRRGRSRDEMRDPNARPTVYSENIL
jgi:hypothetical protein|tara:strand:+ start:85 stop:699 length:615 start_codon:yes stop_codon:yes gene_type:complete